MFRTPEAHRERGLWAYLIDYSGPQNSDQAIS